jgi:D-alanine-D-alanine ligase
MKKVGVLFGGRSVEHEVSVITAMQIIENMDRSKYDPVAIYINKEGKWLTGQSLLSFESFKNNDFKDAKRIMISPNHNDGNLYSHPDDVGLFGKKIVDTIDIFFPAFHGTNGEDGAAQGVLEFVNKPYVGAYGQNRHEGCIQGQWDTCCGLHLVLQKPVGSRQGSFHS